MADTVGKTITCKAAVAWEAAKPLSIEDIEVAPPKAHEVRIQIYYTGVCHTDAYTLSGKDPEGAFPVVLGHEGAGIVESVGEGVTSVKPGDHVVALYTPECRGMQVLQIWKDQPFAVRSEPLKAKESCPMELAGVNAVEGPYCTFLGSSTFSQYTVVADISVVAVTDKAPWIARAFWLWYHHRLWRRVRRRMRRSLRIQGAVKNKAGKIIVVDVNDSKECGLESSVHRFVNPTSSATRASRSTSLMTDGGCDYTFDCTGNVGVMRAALEACHKGWGQSIVIGVAAAGQEISTRPFQLVTGRVWKGCAFGGIKGRSQLPDLVDDYLKGDLKVDEFITHREPLANINAAFEQMKAGDCIRCVVDTRT
uniref:S-(Hydroxymethyl)glutathione dehydrogenase n=1 Tax=Coccidioides posadasii RMSCC 3488 TaxID=454284 RepID=A0A0J6FAT2_COCPO|nr:S-(hydroxymethyl)glutathione dehydrogenase [Coccidioides posadasii RMSCC 3488]